MAYATTAKILGDTTTYQLSPNVKKYSLRDTGFIETKGGKLSWLISWREMLSKKHKNLI